MPDWRVNALEGVYKFGAGLSHTKRYQILADYAVSGSVAVSARQNRVCYNTARAIAKKFIATGDCQAGERGRPARKMEPFMTAYMEAVIYVGTPSCIWKKFKTDLQLTSPCYHTKFPQYP
ncbi:hypothetical protein OS493_026713 [Desmophyllum pertusum]|uniref:Uncharacterized protein n=1 Tax=Desmophyllum pertusum TaxID=174260 RepID=A0A9W9ZZU6_9CNID|nr:hypothetical protein OS493_026713 [Desmophyllum pertusum]